MGIIKILTNKLIVNKYKKNIFDLKQRKNNYIFDIFFGKYLKRQKTNNKK